MKREAVFYVIAPLVVIVFLFLDSHYWFSFVSYGHYPHLTQCHVTNLQENPSGEGVISTTAKFTCREGEITLSLELPVP